MLSVGDLEAAEAFYARLGFVVRTRFPEYLILDRSGAEIHLSLWPEHDPKTTDGMVYLRVEAVDALYDQFREGLAADGLVIVNPPGPLTADVRAEIERRDAAGVPHHRLHELDDTPYGMREFAVVDPAGNLLRIGRPIVG